MSTTVLAVRPRAPLALRLLYGRRAEKVALSPAAAARGVRGWFSGSRAVFEPGMVRLVASPWPPIVRRVGCLLVVLIGSAACGYWPAALVAGAGYVSGVLDTTWRR